MNNYNNQKTISELKANVDIVDYIGSVVTLKKTGSSFTAPCPFHTEASGSFTVSPTKKIFHCFGCGVGGDILDFIEQYHKVSKSESIEKLRSFEDSSYTPQREQQNYKPAPQKKEPTKTKEQIENKLTQISKALINNNKANTIFNLSYNHKEQFNSNTLVTCMINPAFEKLFEKRHFLMKQEHQKRLSYMISYILAYDSFFKCPAIIIRDSKSKVCDIARYRPIKPPSFETFSNPKYMYVKEEDKLKNRGENFLFPFHLEMDRLIDKHSFFFIGEGLKNAINAFLFGVPFISLESTSNGITKGLEEYIKEKAKTKTIIGGFDGDEEIKEDGKITKGHGAYIKAKESLGFEFPNLFKFDSNIDFADYLKDETSLIDFENKFESLFLQNINSNNHEKNL